MKKNYVLNKQVVLALLLMFTVHLTNYAQTKVKSTQTARKVQGKNVSHVFSARAAGVPAEVVSSCGPYTWPTNGVTYSASGTYTSSGITQGYNTQAAYLNNVTGHNSTIATNSLGGLPNTNPIPLTVGSTSVSMGAPGGMYTTGTFVGTNIATDALTITLAPGVYGFSANIYATDISDAVTAGDITVTYSTGFVDARTVASDTEFFGYTSTTPITSVTITCANTVAPFKWPTIKNLSLATGPNATLDLTVTTSPVTGNYSVCQGLPVTGGLTSDLGGGAPPTPLPNFTGDNTGGPTYNRPTAMNQGGTCGNSGAGTAVQYVAHTFTAPVSGDYIFSTCGGATFDTFLSLYQSPFNPAGLCAGNTLIESSDDVCGAQSTVTATLVGGTTYVLVVSGFANNESGPYTVTSTTPTTLVPGVEWYTASTGGTAIGTGSPFNPVGVAGSGLTNTNTVGTTTFYAQFPGETCRTAADFVVTAPPTPTFTQVAPICVGGTLAPLPTTSNNGVTGTWSPAIDATVTTTYTFTPDAGQCGTTTTMTIAVNPLPTVAFTANPFPVCAGSGTVLTANVTNATPTVTFGTQSASMTTAAFGVPVTSPLSGTLALAPSNGCAPFAAGLFAGKIALIQRGTCAFAIKAQNAQDAGAIGVILYNNVAGAIIPGGTAPGVTIPVYGMTLADGQALIAAMTANEVNVTLNPAPPVSYLWGNGDTTQTTNTGVLNADTDFTVTVTNTVTGCSSTVTVTVPVTPLTVPTFNQVAAICSGGTLDPLPTSSLEGLAGTWSPALDNTTTTTYTFTPTPIAGQCLGTATMTITVNQPTAPVFTQVAPICVGGTTTLPTTSDNGFTGTWAPAIDNTVTTTYTFTPDSGQCVDSTVVTMTIVVNPLPTVAFTANPFPVCAGSGTVLSANVTNAAPTVTFGTQSANMSTAAFGVPVTSPLSGTLALAPSNGCAPFAAGLFAGKIALIQRGTCAFTVKAKNAQDAGAIGVILYNNVAGVIIPAGVDPTITIPVYSVTQADGLALIAAMTANEVNVTLNPAPPVTYLWGNGDTTQTTNTGVLNADTDFTVTVTNTVTGCSSTVTVTVPVTPLTVPTFNQVADICTGGTLDPLPTSSLEGLTGTWSPALDNTTTTTYTFTPDAVAGQCLGTTTMTITVNSAAEPTGDAVQNITAPTAADATLEDIVINPTTVVWYPTLADAQAGTNALPNTTLLTNGATYYAVNVVGSCSSTPYAVTVNVTLGNDEFDDVSFDYYPNPTSSILNISYSHMISEVSVTNLLGQQIMTKKTNSTEVQIDLSGLAEATYFVKVISEGKEKVVKVIKKD